MAIHFYDESPSPPGEQLARLRASSLLGRCKIPAVVWGEDALSIVHRVPTELFDQHLLVQDERVADAVEIIYNELNYSPIDAANDDAWGDYKIYNPARPFAFEGTPTTLLQHNDLNVTYKTLEPDRILIHAASTFQFPLQDLSRSCLNPSPPSPESAEVRFPTIAAFYDSLLDMSLEPPLKFVHFRSYQLLRTFVAYLTTYNVSDEGITKTHAPPGEFGLIPSCLQVVDEVKDENKPHLARLFLEMPVDRELVSLERLLIRQARLKDTYDTTLAVRSLQALERGNITYAHSQASPVHNYENPVSMTSLSTTVSGSDGRDFFVEYVYEDAIGVRPTL